MRGPCVSPCENAMHLSAKSDEGDKWVVSVVLPLLYSKKMDRENLLFFGECLGLWSRIKQLLLHHPGIFYTSRKLGSRTVVLRDGYKRDLLVEKRQLIAMRYKYMHLMNMAIEDNKKQKAELGDCGKEKKPIWIRKEKGWRKWMMSTEKWMRSLVLRLMKVRMIMMTMTRMRMRMKMIIKNYYIRMVVGMEVELGRVRDLRGKGIRELLVGMVLMDPKRKGLGIMRIRMKMKMRVEDFPAGILGIIEVEQERTRDLRGKGLSLVEMGQTREGRGNMRPTMVMRAKSFLTIILEVIGVGPGTILDLRGMGLSLVEMDQSRETRNYEAKDEDDDRTYSHKYRGDRGRTRDNPRFERKMDFKTSDENGRDGPFQRRIWNYEDEGRRRMWKIEAGEDSKREGFNGKRNDWEKSKESRYKESSRSAMAASA